MADETLLWARYFEFFLIYIFYWDLINKRVVCFQLFSAHSIDYVS
jgi:hypothetical protein